MLLLVIPDPDFENLILLCFFIQLIVQFQRFLPKYNHLLFQILNAVIRRKHAFLLLRLMLNLCKFLLYLRDVVPIGIEELCLVLLDHMLHLLVHLVDCFVQLAIDLQELKVGLSGDEVRLP